MKTLRKTAEITILIISFAIIIWLLASWADVLMHQFNGDQHAWNAFRIMVESYYGR